MVVLGAIVFATMLQAQIYVQPEETSSTLPKSYPIHASDILWEKEQQVAEYLKAHPEALQRNALRKTTTYSVGQTKQWYADDMSGSGGARFLVSTTCRAIGTNCYVFVEDASWTTDTTYSKAGKVTQKAVDSVRIYFDSKTPANPSKGIFETDTSTFGTPPDVDNDPRIILLILDIKDGYSSAAGGGYVEGYFYSFNEMDPETPGGVYRTSNYAEIFYLDCNPLNLNSENGLLGGISTCAHEFQHMIHYHYDPTSAGLTFINEGCSLVAEVNCGFPIYDQSLFAKEPNHYLLDWRRNDATAVLTDYSRAARFCVYLRDQFGMGLFKPIVTNTPLGVLGIDMALQSIGSPLRFADIIKNWFLANEVNDQTVDTKYGYVYPNLPKSVGLLNLNPNVALTTASVQKYGVQYITFKNSSKLKTTFTVSNPALILKAVEVGPTSKRVVDVTSGVEFSEPLYGSTYNEIDFVIMNTDASKSYNYTYQSSGTSQAIELRYDYSEPTGVYPLAENDTVCVIFDAVQGGKLDSVRVALRRSSTIRGGVWNYSGTTRPSPLGAPLATGLTATGLSTPSSPYPVPWPNWATIDLRSKNISTNSQFAVGFIMDGAYSGTTFNYVMATKDAFGSGPTSLTYSSTSASGPNWYYYTVNTAGDSIVYYLVRAYVSFPPTGVQTAKELTPITFNLGQNYPNPFNPSTSIRIELPERSFVTLKVFDMVGREVTTLVNGFQEAGSHNIAFNAAGLTSGVYFYRISTEKFTETKKLVLIK
jgi:hypothetical protein